jgi:hypothetical protein
MITCPYCNEPYKDSAGLSSHLRIQHQNQWKGSLRQSLPEGFELPSTPPPTPEQIERRRAILRERNRRLREANIAQGLTSAGKPRKLALVGADVAVMDQPRRRIRRRIGGARRGSKKRPIYQDCPFCDYRSNHPPGLAHHIKATHPQHWKGNLGASLGGEPSRTWKTQDRNASKRTWYMRNRDRVKAQRLQKLGKRVSVPALAAGHHPRPGRRPQKLSKTCPVCQQTYKTRALMTHHLRNVHATSITQFERETPRLGMSATAALRLPRNGVQEREERPESTGPSRGHIDFCPRCGENIKAYELAAGFVTTTSSNL